MPIIDTSRTWLLLMLIHMMMDPDDTLKSKDVLITKYCNLVLEQNTELYFP